MTKTKIVVASSYAAYILQVQSVEEDALGNSHGAGNPGSSIKLHLDRRKERSQTETLSGYGVPAVGKWGTSRWEMR